ncbi:unnamed protein product [Ilex paraguariensis]|uniref:C2 domain-containing protein n=1 Tax=Ilex paraguariensis TaxID=185542 RepID=A0ABC8RRV1_9AQUA
MTIGTMEVTLVGAKGLKNTDFSGGGIDPYVLVQYKSQERKSGVARGQGRAPVWNEKFMFRVEYPGADDHYKLILKIMDKDSFTADDYLGQATIYLKEFLEIGVENGTAELPPRKYSVVYSDQSYSGEIQVGITFNQKPSEDKQRRLDLKEEEVEKLEAELDGELKLKKILQCALQGPVHSCSCLSSLLPNKVRVLLAELAMVEEEIIWLERKVDELKFSLHQEKSKTKEQEMLWQQWGQQQQMQLISREGNQTELKDFELLSRSLNCEEYRKDKLVRGRRASMGSSTDIQSMSSTRSTEEIAENSRCSRRGRNYSQTDAAVVEKPNKLSEELIKCLIGIFLQLNQAPLDTKRSAIVPKYPLSCKNSKGFMSKTSFNCTIPACSFDDSSSNLDPYGILPDLDGTIRDVGPYKTFVQITRNSLDTGRVSECFPAMGKLRILMHKLCNVDLTYLTYKQKLAFWINIYNGCIMHAFLQHGLPSTQEKLLALMNKAAMNVGGIVLNALAIEHFILRHPSDSKQGPTDEKEMLLRHAYGLGYPEPNITFALCRGSWSSPAIRIYTPDTVVNELERAKVEYLEASVGVTNKKKIVVPKLLQWHMKDFADDMDSLLEWIYSQLPHSTMLKKLIMECLNGEAKSPNAKMVEVQPYVSEFRYLLPW